MPLEEVRLSCKSRIIKRLKERERERERAVGRGTSRAGRVVKR